MKPFHYYTNVSHETFKPVPTTPAYMERIFKMLYTLYYQKRCGDTVAITRSKSLLKLLKIKLVTYGFDTRAFVAVGREQFNKFDLIGDEWFSFNDFEIKVNAGQYFASYDYRRRSKS